MKIGAFAELTGISAYTLRYYEKALSQQMVDF